MLIAGLIACALARLILPGRDPMNVWMTILLGIAGSFVGFIGNLIWHTEGQSYFSPRRSHPFSRGSHLVVVDLANVRVADGLATLHSSSFWPPS